MNTTWNLKQLYKSDTDTNIEKDLLQSKSSVKKFVSTWKENKEYTLKPTVLKIALDQYEQLHNKVGICDKPYYYFSLRSNLDQTDTKIKGRLNQIIDTCIKLSNDIQFFELEIAKIPKYKQEIFLKSPLLKDYKHFLEQLFNSSKYLLSDNEEKVFNLMSKTSHSNWTDMMSELLDKQILEVVDEKKKKEKIPYNNVSKYLSSRDKKVRDYAVKQFNAVNQRYYEIAEFEINSILEAKKVSDEYRNVERPDTLRHLADDLDTKVVDVLIDTVTNNFDISKKYYKLKAKLLKQKTLGYHERNVPLGDIEIEYTYSNAMNMVKDTFTTLDQEFGNIVEGYIANGQYDVNPKQSKSGGAFCTSINKSLPTYILLNFTHRLEDVLTIAHESGHGIHAELSKTQNSLNSDHPISLAEIASTFFEETILEKILEVAENKENILHKKMNDDISTIFRQVAFYNFEKELHSEFRRIGYLKKEYISDIFCKHMYAYLGDAVDQDESMRYGWIYVSHFRNFFYVYSYASGLLISKALRRMIKEGKVSVEDWKNILRAGSSKSPKDIFSSYGMDISKKKFWEEGLEEVRDLYLEL